MLQNRVDAVEDDVKQIKGGVNDLVKQLSAPTEPLRRRIGFGANEHDTPVFFGDGNIGSGRWLDVSRPNLDEASGSHEVSLSVGNAFGVVTSNFTCTCYWDEPPPPPPGSESDPWQIGDNVQAYTNGYGTLVIIGSGATSNFTAVASVPWAELVGLINQVVIPDEVTVIGDNLWEGLAGGVAINGETIERRKEIATGFPDAQLVGAISGAEFEAVRIVDGKAHLDVSVYSSDTVTNPNWSVATNGVIEVPVEGTASFSVPTPSSTAMTWRRRS